MDEGETGEQEKETASPDGADILHRSHLRRSRGYCGCVTFHTLRMDYQPVLVQKHARPATAKRSSESRYWRQFRHPVFVKDYAPVTFIHFAPSKPHRFAVTSATRVQIYAPRTQKVTKTISRFKDIARSGCIRADGKLVVAGDDTGLVQVGLSPSTGPTSELNHGLHIGI